MEISGHTKPFAVLGHPIGHSLSPVMHNAAFAARGWDAIYLALDVKPGRLMPVLEAMRDMGFAGVNLTIPLKQVAFEGLSALDESARLLGAVNTVEFTAQGLVGHNTDAYGYLKALEEAFGCTVKGDKLLILGAGGAGRAVALASVRAGAAAVTIADLDETRTRAVAKELADSPAEVNVAVGTSAMAEAARMANLIVQATPVGMKESDSSLLNRDAFRKGQRVFDLIYMYPETAFLQVAREAGAQTANGLGMLLHQGAKALSIWTGAEAPVDVMHEALEKAVYTK